MVQLYLKHNIDWNSHNKCMYGIVNEDTVDSLIDLLYNSSSEHNELSYYSNVWIIEKNNYILPYTDIDTIFSIVARDTRKIKWIENQCNITLPYLRQLNNVLLGGLMRNKFVQIRGTNLIQDIIEHDFPKIGLNLINEYSKNKLDKVYNDTKKRINNMDIIKNTGLMAYTDDLLDISIFM